MSPPYPVHLAFITFVMNAKQNLLSNTATVWYYIDLNKQKDLSNKVRNREIGQS